MQEATSEPSMCRSHPKKPIKYFCFSENCAFRPSCCILCIKNKHKHCDMRYQLDAAAVVELLRKAKQVDPEALKVYRRAYSNVIAETRDHVSDLMDSNVRRLNDKCTSTPELSLENLHSQKSMYCFNYDRATRKIVISSLLSLNNKSFKGILDRANELLATAVNTFATQLTMYLPENRLAFKAKDFKHHPFFDLTDDKDKLVVSLPQSNENYYVAMLRNPVNGSFHFKIKVFNLNPIDRYVEVGFLPPETYKNMSLSCVGKFLCGAVCYCGYRFKGFKGPIPALSLDSSAGLEDDDEVFFAFNFRKKLLTVYSEKKGWKHTAKVELQPPFHLYFCLYFLNQKFELTHLPCL